MAETAGMTSSRVPYDLSECDRALIEHLSDHIESEKDAIDLYDALAHDEHPYVRFVAELIGEDEARHHRLFEEWIETIKALAELRDAPDGIPHVDFRPVPPETIQMVERLLEFEQADLVTTRALRREVRDVRTSTLWGMVVDLVIADTKKHIKVLKFLRARLQEREVSPSKARA
jgi:rubrerythrin